MLGEWVTTSTILSRLERHDDPVWTLFVSRFRRPIEAFAREAGLSADAAEDAAQETLLTFTEAFRAGKYVRSDGRLAAWLFGTAHNKVRGSRRAGARAGHASGASGAARETGATDWTDDQAAARWEDAWRREVLSICLERVREEVGENTFLAFEAYALRNIPAEVVAKDLGIAKNTVFVAKHRVLTRVRELRREYESVNL